MNSIVITDGRDNVPGMAKLNFVPVHKVSEIPDDESSIVVDPIDLTGDTEWLTLDFAPGKLIYDAKGKDGSSGPFFDLEVSGFHPAIDPIKTNNLRLMLGSQFIIVAYDQNGYKRIVGSIDSPAEFIFSETSATFMGTQVAGYHIKFSTQATLPALFYQATIEEGVPVPGADVGVIVSPEIFWYNSSNPDIAADPPSDYKRRFPQAAGKDLDEVALFIGGPVSLPNLDDVPDWDLVSLDADGTFTRNVPFPEKTMLLLIVK